MLLSCRGLTPLPTSTQPPHQTQAASLNRSEGDSPDDFKLTRRFRLSLRQNALLKRGVEQACVIVSGA